MSNQIFKDEEIPSINEELPTNDELPSDTEGDDEIEITEPPKEEPRKKGKHKTPVSEERRAQLASNLAKGRIKSLELRAKKKIEKQQIKLKETVMTDDVKMKIYNEIKEQKEKDSLSFKIQDLYKKLDYLLSDKDKTQIKEIKKEIQAEVKEAKAEVEYDEDDDLPPKSPTIQHNIELPQETKKIKHYSTLRGIYFT